jgi:uncharacterized protein with ParB-like and HNH nuclease domain
MSYKSQSITVNDLISHIENHYLPAIQREFVWSSLKTENLFDSMLRGYPIGTMLLWDVQVPAIHEFPFYELIRNFDIRKSHNIKANLNARTNCLGILDGQQRITSLYIGLCGSYIEKEPRLWVTNPNAYLEKKLCMNLLYSPKPDDESSSPFQIKFLTKDRAKNSEQSYWFLLSDILKYKTRNELRDFRRTTIHKDNEIFENSLDALWTAIHENQHVHYFLEPSQDLERVLKIFHRLNTGATPLEHSDLLLSLATATWKQHDAREQIYHLVDDLNQRCGSTFYFSKNFVLKTLLMCSDRDVRFRAENVGKKMQLEDIWERVQKSLSITVKLLAQFGINFQTLTAPNAAVCIAYYIFKRNLEETYLTDKRVDVDREQIRVWLLKSQLARVFSGQTDRILTIIRNAIKSTLEKGTFDFPATQIEQALQVARPFSFTEEYIQSLVFNTRYGNADTFAILGLLFPYLKFTQQQYSIDHLHPQAQCDDRVGMEHLGMKKDEIDFIVQNKNGLANLQLLPASMNSSKNKRPLEEWLKPDEHETAEIKAIYRSWCLIPDTDLSITNFRDFYEKRHTKIVEALKVKLGYTPTAPVPVETDLDLESQDEDDLLNSSEITLQQTRP